MARRPVAVVAAIVLLVEAVGIVVLNWHPRHRRRRQDMSLAGLDPDAMSTRRPGSAGSSASTSRCAAGGAAGGAARPAPAGFGRILLISAAVVHGVLGAFAVGLVGWDAFVFMMVVLALIVLHAGGVRHGAAGERAPTPGARGAATATAATGCRRLGTPPRRQLRPQVGDPDAQLGQQPAQQRQREADDIAVVAVDAVDERGRAAVQGERARHVQRFAAGDVGGDLRVGRLAEADDGGRGRGGVAAGRACR